MCTPECIIEMLGFPTFYDAVKAIIKAGKYKMYVDNLRTELRRLEDARVIIERRVCQARDRGEEIENAVTHWQEDEGRMENDVHELIGQVEARIDCFGFSCPNIMWRYRLGEQAEEKIRNVERLVEYSRHFEEISYTKPPPPELEFPSAENYVHLDSRTPIFEQIVLALKDPNVKTIGVHGLGGVGKTTLVEKVAKKLLDDRTFKQIPLATVSKVLNVKEIQKKLADELNLLLDARADEKANKIKLWHKFNNGDKYLVILDDIWEMVDLNAIGIPITDGQRGCKVVLTSRNKDLLEIKMKADKNFPIEELSEAEAWDLFKKQVGNSMESQPGVESLAREVCQKCKGLPVAIKALGGALEGKPRYMWDNALVKLKRSMLTNIEDISSSVCATLRVSYDMLESTDAKSCFLLCCLFAEAIEISIDDLTRHCVARSLLSQNPRTLEEARDAVRTVVYILKSTSLLSNGNNENVVRIHDVIRYVGISIAREEQAFLVDHGALQWSQNLVNELSAISLNSGKIGVLPDGLVYPQLHTLILDNNELSDLEVPDKFFSGMKQLAVLILIRICMLRLPSSLAKLSNLRMLCLNQCELADIAILRDLKTNLEVLSLRGSNIEALPPEMAQLTSLRVLDLRDCDDLKLIPQGIISNLTNLEELYFSNIFDMEEYTTDEEEYTTEYTTDEEEYTTDKEEDTCISRNVIEEIWLLLNTGQLTTLHIHIPSVTLLPKEDLMLENLKGFRIAMGTNFNWDEDFAGTRVLKYGESSLRKEFIPLMDKAEALYLSGIKGLKKVLDYKGVGNEFLDLKYLKVESCEDDLEYLLGEPKSSVQSHGLYPFKHLTDLIVEKCKLKYLLSPTTARGLVHLEHLRVVSCESMEEIVGFEGQTDGNELILSKLKSLYLQSLPNLTSFYAEKEKTQSPMESSYARAQPLFTKKVVLPVLEELQVVDLDSIEEIWDKQSPSVNQETMSFSQLKYITVEGCTKLVNLVPSNILPRLRNLQFLYVRECPNVELVVFKNKKGEEGAVDDSTLIIPRLTHLEIRYMEKLKSFYSSSTTSNAQSLFNHQVILPVLEVLQVKALDSIEEIWDNQPPSVNQETASFSQLRNITVKRCKKLINLIPSNILPRLRNLQFLDVKDCPNVEFIVFKNKKGEEEAADDSTLIIPQLRSLWIENMEKLKSFCSSSTTSNAQSLFNHQVAFPVLKDIYILRVSMITDIWPQQPLSKPEKEVESFCELESILVSGCDQFEYVLPSYMLPQLHNLLQLEICFCKELEVIVSNKLKEKEATNNDILVFPQLTTLELEGLDNLKCFCTGGTDQLLFSHKVAFPTLEHLTIGKVPKIKEIWDKQPLPEPEKKPKSFYKLMFIHVEDCDQLVYVFPSSMLPQLQNLQKLVITNCKEMEVIISNKLKEKEATDNDIILFAELKTVILQNLPNLKRLCAEMQLGFSNKDAFPVLEINIKELTIKNLWQLRDLKTSCIAPNLMFLVNGTSTNEVATENGDDPMATSMEKPRTLVYVTDKSKSWQVAETQCQLVAMLERIDGPHKVARLLYTNFGDGVLALGCNGSIRLWKWGSSKHNPSGKATASVVPQQWQPASGLAMTNDVTGAKLEEVVPCIALSKNDCYVISACGGVISLFNMMTFKAMTTFMPPPPTPTFLALHPQDNNLIAIGMEDSTIHIYNVGVDEVKSVLEGHQKRITGLAFSTNLNILVSSGVDAQLCIWSIDKWKKLKSVPIQLAAGKARNDDIRVQFHSNQIGLLVSHETQLAIYDANRLVSHETQLAIYDPIRQCISQDVLPAPISFAAYSCDSQLVYTTFCDGNIGVFDAESLTLRCRIAPSTYLSPALLSGSQAVYPFVVAAHPQLPNQFAIGLTDGSVIVMELPTITGEDGGTASSSNASNQTSVQEEDVDVDEDALITTRTRTSTTSTHDDTEDLEEKRKKE